MNDQNNNQKRDLGAKTAISLPSLCAGSWDVPRSLSKAEGGPGGSDLRAGACKKFGVGRMRALTENSPSAGNRSSVQAYVCV